MKVWILGMAVSWGIIVTFFLLQKKKKIVKENAYAEFYYFYTTWCPYCKKSMVEWKNFKQEWNQKVYQGYTLKFIEVDCDKEESLANKYNITQYPTIKLIKDGTVLDFDAKPTVFTLTSFLNSSFE